MVEKLKAKREALVAEEKALLDKLNNVQGKIGIVNEMIAEEGAEESTPVELATATAERTIEFGTVKPRTSF